MGLGLSMAIWVAADAAPLFCLSVIGSALAVVVFVMTGQAEVDILALENTSID